MEIKSRSTFIAIILATLATGILTIPSDSVSESSVKSQEFLNRQALLKRAATQPIPASILHAKPTHSQPLPARIVWADPTLAPTGSIPMPPEYGEPNQYYFSNFLLSSHYELIAGSLGSHHNMGILILETVNGATKVLQLGNVGATILTGFSPSQHPIMALFKTSTGKMGTIALQTGVVSFNP